MEQIRQALESKEFGYNYNIGRNISLYIEQQNTQVWFDFNNSISADTIKSFYIDMRNMNDIDFVMALINAGYDELSKR